MIKWFKNRVVQVLIALGILTVALGQVVPPPLATDVMVKVGNSASFQNGDIMAVMTSRRILDVHASHVVHPRNMPRTEHGTVAPNSLLEYYLEATKEYKFERISDKEVRRTNLWTSAVDTFSDVPNASGERIDVPLYIERRLALKPNQNLIFGNAGSEYWYGGNDRKTDAIMDDIWDEIERVSSNERSFDFPFTEKEKQKYLLVKVNDLTDAEAGEMVAPLLNLDGEVVERREHKIDLTGFDLGRVNKDFRGNSPVDINTLLQ